MLTTCLYLSVLISDYALFLPECVEVMGHTCKSYIYSSLIFAYFWKLYQKELMT